MKFTRVTITGADDAVDHRHLAQLSASFPFVEWGILYSRERQGSARYPGDDWFMRLWEEHCAGRLAQNALHLCGTDARRAMMGDDRMLHAGAFQRIQLNGFSAFRLPGLLVAERWPHKDFILQCASFEALGEAAIMPRPTNVSALIDPSGGRGKPPNDFPMSFAGLRTGYAGGIGPDNVVEIIKKICSLPADAETWIDMESGVRTNDMFDLDKVRRVLELARPYIVGKERDRAS